jgi:hypothetical protein
MRAATFGLLALVVMNLCALPRAQAMKADTLWTKLQNDTLSFSGVVLSPDDRLVGAQYSGGRGNQGYVLWDLRTGAEVWRLPTVDSPPDWMRFTPDAKSVILYRSRVYEKYDLGERTRMTFESDGDTSDISPGDFRMNDISADGRLFLSTKRTWYKPHTIDQEITLWDVATGRIVRKVKIPGLDVFSTANGVRFSADTNRLLVLVPLSGTDSRQQWQVFDIPTGTLTPLAFSSVGAKYREEQTQIVLSPDKTRIAAYEEKPYDPQNRKGIRILDGYTFATIATLPSGLADPGRVAEGGFTRDNSTYIASAEKFQVWDIASKSLTESIDCSRLNWCYAREMNVSSDGRYLALGWGLVAVVDRSIDTTVSHVGDPGSTPNLYPNPSTHSVHIPTTTAMHSGFVLDIIPIASGQSISYDPTLLRRTPDELVVDVSSLASGTYLFRLRAPGVEPVAVTVAVER